MYFMAAFWFMRYRRLLIVGRLCCENDLLLENVAFALALVSFGRCGRFCCIFMPVLVFLMSSCLVAVVQLSRFVLSFSCFCLLFHVKLHRVICLVLWQFCIRFAALCGDLVINIDMLAFSEFSCYISFLSNNF